MIPKNLEFNDNPTFSMSIATLMRIDLMIKQLSAFQKIRHRKAVIRHLRELHKELYPFLKEDERVTAWAYWKTIAGLPITAGIPAYFERLDEFDFWLRDMLFKKGILMAKREDPSLAIMKMR